MIYDDDTRTTALAALRETGNVALVARAQIVTEQTLRNWAKEEELDIAAIRKAHYAATRARALALAAEGRTSEAVAAELTSPKCRVSGSLVRKWVSDDGRYVGLVKRGRPPTTRARLLQRLPEIQDWVRTRKSKRALARHLGVSRSMLDRFLAAYVTED